MHVGAVFPQLEIGASISDIRWYATSVDQLGYAHLAAYDHVVGADPATHENWQGIYDVTSQFHEPMVLFGYFAALTSVELVTNVLVLPQRQTVLVAKQAAELDLMTGGRLRLGVGVGWNAVEYEALGAEFGTRGRRMDEQILLLRRLWRERSVTHRGIFDTVTGAGLAPLPIQRPIPVWIGAMSAAGLRRAGRLADGWFPLVRLGRELEEARAQVHDAAAAAGRDPSAIGMEGRIQWRAGGLDRFEDEAGRWRDAGATHMSVSTMKCGFQAAEQHIEVLAAIADRLRLPARTPPARTPPARTPPARTPSAG